MQLAVLTARFRHLILLCGALLLVSACQSAPAAPSPASATSAPAATFTTVVPTLEAAPSSAPPATNAPAPTVAPQPTAAAPTALLPAPVYLLDDGQIWRMERDGQTRRQLTFESSDILDFTIGATDNALAYVIGTGAASTLVLLDASGRTELMRGSVWGPQISPSGEQIAFERDEPTDEPQSQRAKVQWVNAMAALGIRAEVAGQE